MKKPTTVFIDKEYLSFVPRPTLEQYTALFQSIKKDSLLSKLIVNQDGKILDGHTRFKICSELNIIPDYEVKKFDNINDERLFVTTINLKRRHLTDFQIVELAQQQLIELRKQVKIVNYQHLKNKQDSNYIPTSQRNRNDRSPFYSIAGTIGVLPTKIEHCLRILKSEDQKLISDVREQRVTVTHALKKLEKKGSRTKRYNFKDKNIPRTKVFRFCPVCGTETLESHYAVVEIHCTKCDYFYKITRRHH